MENPFDVAHRPQLDITQLTNWIETHPVIHPMPTDLFRGRVPIGLGVVFSPRDTFGLYIPKLEEFADGVIADDGGVLTHKTADAISVGINDVVLSPVNPVIGDRLLIGSRFPFSNARIKWSTPAGATARWTWEYWNGTAMTTIVFTPPILDEQRDFRAVAGTYDFRFRPPHDWVKSREAGVNLYWLQARATATVTATHGLGDQIWINSDEELDPGDMVNVEVRDIAEQVTKPILQHARYQQLKEFADPDRLRQLTIPQPVEALSGSWIAVSVKPSAGVINHADSYFKLTYTEIARTLF